MNQTNSNEIEREKRIKSNEEDSKPILAELSEIGIDVEWISYLYNKHINYKNAIPVLLKWLPIIENQDVKESIVRALSVRWARKTTAPKLLIKEFRKAKSDSGLQWAIANALSVIADDEVFNEIIALIREKAYGNSREMLVVALGNMKTPEVEEILIELLEDEDLAGYAIMALRKKKSKKAKPYLEKFLHYPKTWVRREAIKAIQKIDEYSH